MDRSVCLIFNDVLDIIQVAFHQKSVIKYTFECDFTRITIEVDKFKVLDSSGQALENDYIKFN